MLRNFQLLVSTEEFELMVDKVQFKGLVFHTDIDLLDYIKLLDDKLFPDNIKFIL